MKLDHPVVAGIPRGAMEMASIIAKELGGELSALWVHKISTPTHPEFSLGCVGVSGFYHFSKSVTVQEEDDLKELTQQEVNKLKRRKEKLQLPQVNTKNKTLIIVDDGIATGETVKCALHEAHLLKPKKIILATPVCSRKIYHELTSMFDQMVVLQTPHTMMSVGEFYQDFSQVTDEEVLKIILLNT